MEKQGSSKMCEPAVPWHQRRLTDTVLGQSQRSKEEIIPLHSALIILLPDPKYRRSIGCNWIKFSRGTALVGAGALVP